MLPSIFVSRLGWSTPDGTAVLTDLNFTFSCERAGIVGRNGVGKTTLLKLVSGMLAPAAGRVTVNGTVSMLRQIVQLAPGETVAHLFGATGALSLLRRAEEGKAQPDELADADWTIETRIAAALERVGLQATPDTPLASFSGGQWTRAALAAAIFAEPDFLLLDEPTNNLDREGRAAVIDLIRGWRKGAIVVSHDRELLEEMDSIVEMSSLGMARYGGNWSHYEERRAIELAAARQQLDLAERDAEDVRRRTQVAIERKARRDGVGNRRAAKGDMPRILIGKRRNNAENSSGNNARLAERQQVEAEQALQAAKAQVEVIEPLFITLTSTGLPSSRTLIQLRDVSAGHGEAPPVLHGMNLSVTGPERIAVVGPNGAGKSTLLDVIAGRLKPRSGQVRLNGTFALLDQRMSILDAGQTVAENFERLNPGMDDNACRAALAHFRFRAEAADRPVSALSGGQMLRAGLACVIGGKSPPSLLMLDEPTNHLDLESLSALEAGLAAYDGALLVVSHDEMFLGRIGTTRRIRLPGGDD